MLDGVLVHVFMRVLILEVGLLNLMSFLVESSFMASFTPAMMALRGFTFHPLLCKVLISGSYLVCLCSRALSKNLSWKYMNSMN